MNEITDVTTAKYTVRAFRNSIKEGLDIVEAGGDVFIQRGQTMFQLGLAPEEPKLGSGIGLPAAEEPHKTFPRNKKKL